MIKENYQAYLSRQRRNIKLLIRPLKLERLHWNYLKTFFLSQRKLVYPFLILLAIQFFLEVILIILCRKFVYLPAFSKYQVWLYILLGIFLCYVVSTYFYFKKERFLVLTLINDLRRRWFKVFLSQHVYEPNQEDKTNLIAKLSYHLTLLSTGASNAVVGFVHWVFYFVIMLLAGFIFYQPLIFIALIGAGISLVVAIVSYYISKFYITQEVTLYSQIIKHISLTLLEWPLIKTLHQEKRQLKKLDELVKLDTHFRVRRDVWLRASSRILYGVIITITGVFILLGSSHSGFAKLFNIKDALAYTLGIFFVIRLSFEALRAGLYFIPAKLGLILTVPDRGSYLPIEKKQKPWQQIIFHTPKVKFFQDGEYLKDVRLSFSKGGRYLIAGESFCGKTSLGYLLAGQGIFNRKNWIVEIDKQRFFYNDWAQTFNQAYFFPPQLITQTTLGELITGKAKEDFSDVDFENINFLSQKYPEFIFVSKLKKFLGEPTDVVCNNQANLFAAQAMYCLLNKPKLIVIDNYWVDSGYKEIFSVIKNLSNDLPDSTIIMLSRATNNILTYEKIYTFKAGAIA